MNINASGLGYAELNNKIRNSGNSCTLTCCSGQRFIAAGMKGKKISINGVPGNALGAYLNGAEIEVNGNAQDAVGDTMNSGTIIVHGSIGDAMGYAMRDGQIFVRDNAGYRAGIHMKEYKEKKPVVVIGGRAGSFLGEYQAGGIIIVLGLNTDGKPIVGNYPCTGMHGGRMFLRTSPSKIKFPRQVTAAEASTAEKEEIRIYIEKYCRLFDRNVDEIMDATFTVITPDSKNPYKQMYVAN